MIFLSEFGFSFIKGIMETVYGERGKYENSLRRYINSPEWSNACRLVKSVDQLPTLSIEQVKQEIHWDERMRYKAFSMQQFVQSHQGKMSNDDYCQLAGEMGLAPSPCPWEETLFPHVLDLWASSEEQMRTIYNLVEEHQSQIAYIGNIMMDFISNGQAVSYKHPGTGRTLNLRSQGYTRTFYRGENAYYGQSRPVLFRNISDDSKKAISQQLIGFVKVCEFSLWIKRLQCVQQWPTDVLHGAIAQHYGIPTNGLDVTSDLNVALFFACCTYDDSSHVWRPLKKEEFENQDSRSDVAKLGGDSRYGVLFSAPADISFISKEIPNTDLHFTCPTPIGYQPFMRCDHQRAYIIEAAEPYNMYLDATFAKYKIRLTEELCQWIFEKMHQGRDIYPNEGLTTYLPVINQIKQSKEYTEEALKTAIDFYRFQYTKENAMDILKREGYTCTQTPSWNSKELLNLINASVQ